MRWIRRSSRSVLPGQQQPHPASDDPAEVLRTLDELDRYVNRNAGGLPTVAVVKARWVTDTLREILKTAEVRPIEVHAMSSVIGTARDYLPTTLRSYLLLGEDMRRTLASGHQPSELLTEQLDTLLESVALTLVAVRSQDADALVAQGSFLRTKFARSDLDL